MKRARQNKKRRIRNQSRKTRVKHLVRAVRLALTQNNLPAAETTLSQAGSLIARVAAKGTLHWRTAARKISRLTRQVNSLKSAT